MIISLIVAVDEQNGMAWQGKIPWHLPAELKLFKQTTTGHHLLMGRKTFETIGKPLPGRKTIVISRHHNYHPEGCLVAHSLEDGLALARTNGESEIYVCGGGEIYEQTIASAGQIYLTVVHTLTNVDLFFPPITLSDWQEMEIFYHPADDKNAFAFTRKILAKIPLPKVDKP